MREDYMEALDTMFPDGYGIIYSCPDSQLRWAHYNPNSDKLIDTFYNFANEKKLGDDDE